MEGDRLIVTRGRGRDVVVRFRDEERKRQTMTIGGYWPYCFVHEDDSEHLAEAVKVEDGYEGVYGEPLSKITVASPEDISYLNKRMETWEGNIPYVNRVLSDRCNDGHEPIPNYDHRIWYLDCEWSPLTKQLRVMVVYDNFTDNEYVWFVHPEYAAGKYDKIGDYEYSTPALAFNTEREMLQHFVKHMKRQDPDIITGWFVTGADIKTIMERMRKNHLNPYDLSPYARVNYNYGDWDQPIVGRNCIDLMIAFSKLWEIKNGKLPAYGLSDVALEVLKKDKVELPDGHDTYHSDIATYIHYCRQDVRLLPMLDNKINALNYYTSVQHLVQCDIRSTPFVTKTFTILALRDKQFEKRIPTRPQFDKVKYSGAEVMEPVPGIYDNVGILDVKAMYHSNARQSNISWDTLDETGVDCGNGTRFNLGEPGLLVRQMDYMTNLRNHYKSLMKTEPENYDKWDTMQFACKSLVASMYGVAGDAKYGLYHPEVASAITYTSRATLGRLKEEAEKRGMRVIYGHTDSVFCIIPTPQAGTTKTASINAEMTPIEVEFEKWCSRMIILAKNRYAGLVEWTDGKTHEPKPYYKGIEMKQSRMPKVMKTVMSDVITGMLSGLREEEVTSAVRDLIDDVMQGNIAVDDLCMKGELKKDLGNYKQLSGPSAGAAWANEFLGKGYRKGSFFKVTINTKGKYIAFDEPSEIDGIEEIGFSILVKRFIVKKLEPYYVLAKWDMQPLFNAMNGLGTTVWL